ncbi:MAG: threonine/homoserine/homoserine lactone efflux protein [Sneathiella sp.]|jgi:threonine/homoserine/homoserine lactone efflux protein
MHSGSLARNSLDLFTEKCQTLRYELTSVFKHANTCLQLTLNEKVLMTVAIYPLITYSLINSATPGPNNIMLATSGVNFGFRRTVPHIFGVYFGFLFMLAVVCFGLGQVFDHVPLLQDFLRYAGSLYLLYLAWRIFWAAETSEAITAKPLTFFEAALFQYINPKAWIMAGTIPAAFATGDGVSYLDIAVLVGGQAIGGFPPILLWVVLGTQLRRLLASPRSRKVFNAAMAALLVFTVFLILTE